MKLSDYVINFLIKNGNRHIFEVCGGAIVHLLDSTYKKKDIFCVSMHHEQAASFAAEGYSRAGNNIGVAMATSGPGATNLITGIASCFFDSVPCIFITGQVNTYEFKFNSPVRQAGFQETDIVSIVKPIVKESILVTEPKKIEYYLEKALYLATSGRPGPVLLDIPMNIQRAEINPVLLKSFHREKTRKAIKSDIIRKIIRLIKEAKRPVILAGGGLRAAGAVVQLREFVKKTKIPVVVSLMGKDSFAHNKKVFAGMIGVYGNRYANLAIANSDLVLALGTRLDTRQTGTRPETFARAAKIIHVDIDEHEIRRNKIKKELCLRADLKDFLGALNKDVGKLDKNRLKGWLAYVNHCKNKFPSFSNPAGKAITPNFLMHKLSECLPKDAIICADVGQAQIWAAQSLILTHRQRFLTQGGMGAMGSSLPMAIGASFANPRKVIVVICGDGGFQLNIQELETVLHHRLPIKIIIINNSCYGMVRQFQRQYFNSRFQSTVIGYSCPDFKAVASGYKIPSQSIRYNSEVDKALREIFKDKKPRFLEVKIGQQILVLPKLAVNKPLEEQEPALSDDELKRHMVIELLR